jgi:D-3-phosphoglycerate dehydrogenase
MKILIADQFDQSGIDALRAVGCDVMYQPELTESSLPAAVGSIGPEVLIVRSTKVMDAALAGGSLSLVVRAGAGVNTIDVASASRRGIYVSNCPGKNAVAVAELAFGLIIALDRRLADNVADLRAGHWNKKEYSIARGLHGRTIGLLGFGNIGQEMARRAKSFGLRVLVWSRRFTTTGASALHELPHDLDIQVVHTPEELAEHSDILSVHLALTADTRNLVGRAVLNRLNPGSYFINTARAEIVDAAALMEAVKTRHLRVGVDVFAKEPSGSTGAFEDPIVQLPGVYGTHHIGASTDQAQAAIAAETVRVVLTYKDTGRVPNAVNLSKTTPATYMLVVRHRDRPGVLAHIFEHLREARLNVQETENIIFEGAEAAVARINLDGKPADGVLQNITRCDENILSLQLVRL